MHDPVNDPHDRVNSGIAPPPQFCIKNMTLENKKIVVAGGTSGIGRALVQLLAEEKAAVTAIGRDQTKLAALKKELPSVRSVGLDASDRPALDDFFKGEQSIDHLVLALGSSKGGGPFTTLSVDELRLGFDGKVWPQLQALQAALPFMHSGGSITFITGCAATAGLPGTSGLAAINGALEVMVPILSKELKPLRVNAVSPGMIDTPWWDFLPAGAKEQVFTDFSSGVNVGRVGRPEEVANTIRVILATEYINGVTIGCHGGL
jgi:NAD(P)-dependent dehydrogenase (short-subunit alcohol dehydrogenase family)